MEAPLVTPVPTQVTRSEDLNRTSSMEALLLSAVLVTSFRAQQCQLGTSIPPRALRSLHCIALDNRFSTTVLSISVVSGAFFN